MMWGKSLAAQAGGENAPKEEDDAVKTTKKKKTIRDAVV